ncbi:hypothetical protein ACQP3J_32300, partial [Escherichia coli]
ENSICHGYLPFLWRSSELILFLFLREILGVFLFKSTRCRETSFSTDTLGPCEHWALKLKPHRNLLLFAVKDSG